MEHFELTTLKNEKENNILCPNLLQALRGTSSNQLLVRRNCSTWKLP